MESDTLIDGKNGSTVNAYSTVHATAGVPSPKFTQKTVIGEVRNWKRFSWLEWIFVAVASISILGILAVSIQRFVYFEKHFKNISIYENETIPYRCNDWTCTNDFIFTVVLVLNTVFSAVYAMDGLLRERMFKIVGYAATIVVIMFYVIANYATRHRHQQLTEPLRLARLVLVLILGPINIALSSIISYKMGYFIFTTVGSSTTLIRAYKIRSFFLTLQYFLLQVMANVLALSWSRDGQYIPIGERIIVCLLLIHCVIVILLGWSTVMFEKHWLVHIWYFILAPYFAYFVYKIVNVSVNRERYETKVKIFESMTVKTNFRYIRLAIIAACTLGLVILVLLYIFMALALKHFKKGLKDKVPPPVNVWQGVCNCLSV